MASSSNNIKSNAFQSRFTDWIDHQQQDIDELNNLLMTTPSNDANLREVIGRILDQFQDYINMRSELALFDAPSLFCQSWRTTLEKSHLWIGGCRPTMFIRMVLVIYGMETVASTLQEYIRGVRTRNLGELNDDQLNSINTLQMKTVREEDALYAKMTSIQLGIGDEPLMKIVRNARRVGEWTGEVMKELEADALNMGNLVKDADKLRMDTLRDLLDILTPIQAVDLLITAKKLLLSLHEWGKVRDIILRRSPIITNPPNTSNNN